MFCQRSFRSSISMLMFVQAQQGKKARLVFICAPDPSQQRRASSAPLHHSKEPHNSGVRGKKGQIYFPLLFAVTGPRPTPGTDS